MSQPSPLAFLAVAGALLAAASAPAVEVTGLSVSATPASHSGPCPVEIKFTGKIALNKAGRATYKWVRSDGGIDTLAHPPVVFPAAGTQVVTTTWTLGAATPAFQPFNGWMKLHVLTPQDKLSAPAKFTINCRSPNQPPTGPSPGQGKPDLVPLLRTPMEGWVAVKNIGAGPAGPSRLFLKCVKVGYAGPGGGCGALPTPLPPPFFATPDYIDVNVPALAPGGEFTAVMPFWSKIGWTKGTFNFTATADATSLVGESNEGNNVTNSSMTR